MLYVIDGLLPDGAQTSLAAMAPRLVADGIDMQVAYLQEKPGLQARFRQSGAVLHHLPGPGRLERVGQCRALVERLRPTLVHTTLIEADITGRLASRLSGVPVVSSLVNVQYGPEQFEDPRIRSWRLRLWQAADMATGQLVRRFHAVAHGVADTMARRLLVTRDKIDVVPRGRDQKELGDPSADRRQRVRDALAAGDDRLILAVGRLAYQKGFDVLLKAFREVLTTHPNARLLIAGGEGSASHDLASQMRSMGLMERVTLLGHRADVPDLLCAADVFVLCSRREGSPGSLIEAMAMAVPSVTVDLPVVREMVGDPPAAQIAAIGDHRSIAAGIVRMLDDPDGARAMGELGRRIFLHRYTLDAATTGIEAFYERALSRTCC